jgi:RHS repeat-associated protein
VRYNITSILDPAGHTWGYSLLPSNDQLLAIGDPNSHYWRFGYDSHASGHFVNDLSVLLDPNGNSTNIGYDDSTDGDQGNVTSVTDPLGSNTTTYEYVDECGDCQGTSEQTAATDSSGDQVLYGYTDLELTGKTFLTSSLSNPFFHLSGADSWGYTYTTSPYGETIYNPNLSTSTIVTDGVGNVLSSTDFQTGSKTQYAYNSYNEACWTALPGVTVSIPPPSCSSPPSGSSSNTYDIYGNLASSSDALGNTTHYGFNSYGQECWETDPGISTGSSPTCTAPPTLSNNFLFNTENELLAQNSIDGSGVSANTDVSVYTYNAYGEVLTAQSPDGDEYGLPASYTTSYAYDSAGRLYQVTGPMSRTATATLDPDGNVTKVVDPYGLVTTSAYTADNQLCWTYLNATTDTTCGTYPTGSTVLSYRGDTNDVTRAIDPNGNATNTTYISPFFPDSPTTVTDATGDVTSYVYDILGNTCVDGTGPVNFYSTSPICTWQSGYSYSQYLQNGALFESEDPSGNVTQYAYTNNAFPTSPTQVTPPSPIAATSTAYDADGRTVSATTGNGGTITQTYTATGQLCWKMPVAVTSPSCSSPPAGITTTAGSSKYSYSYANRPLVMTDTQAGGIQQTSSWTYDSNGQILSNTSDNGLTTSYAYDDAGDNICVAYPVKPGPNCSTSPSSTNTVVDYSFDADGRMSGLNEWLGNSFTFGYNAQSDLTNINFPSSTGWTEQPSYDADNNLTNVAFKLGAATANYPFGQNADDLINSEVSGSFGYNARKEITTTPSDNYGYNANGTIATDTPTGQTAISYTENGASEVTKIVNPNLSATVSYAYDADGNRCAAIVATTTPSCSSPTSGTVTYGWDAYNQLCWTASNATGPCSSPPTGASTYTYDGTGLRTSDSNGGVAQNFGYDTATRQGEPLIIQDGTNAYIYGPADFGSGTAPLEQISISAGTPTYLFTLPSGVAFDISSSGTLNSSCTYTPYGARSTTGSGTTSPFGFQGAYTDPSGLNYMINRYYESSAGQFLSVDPAVVTTGTPYTYAGSDPINDTDPLGLESLSQFLHFCATNQTTKMFCTSLNEADHVTSQLERYANDLGEIQAGADAGVLVCTLAIGNEACDAVGVFISEVSGNSSTALLCVSGYLLGKSEDKKACNTSLAISIFTDGLESKDGVAALADLAGQATRIFENQLPRIKKYLEDFFSVCCMIA